jgi:hypothetical protein
MGTLRKSIEDTSQVKTASLDACAPHVVLTTQTNLRKTQSRSVGLLRSAARHFREEHPQVASEVLHPLRAAALRACQIKSVKHFLFYMP